MKYTNSSDTSSSGGYSAKLGWRGKQLVKNGLAEVVIYDKRRPWKYQEELLSAQDQAKKQKFGLWSTSVK